MISYNKLVCDFRLPPRSSWELLSSGLFQDSWTLRMGKTGCPETLVKNYHYSLRNNPEKRSILINCWLVLHKNIEINSKYYYSKFRMCEESSQFKLLICTDIWHAFVIWKQFIKPLFHEQASLQGSYFLKSGKVYTHDCLREHYMTVEICGPHPIIIDKDTALQFSFGCKTINCTYFLLAVFS